MAEPNADGVPVDKAMPRKIVSGIDAQDFWLVALGGAAGGFMQPILAAIKVTQQTPQLGSWIWGPFLGIAAAGITVFVLANSNTENKLRLLFFSLLCGLTFPSVLAGAVDSMNKKSNQVVQQTEKIDETKARGDSKGAAKQLTTTMVRNPATSEIDPEAQVGLETTGKSLVVDIGGKAVSDPEVRNVAIEQLEEIGKTARVSGYNGVALQAAEELKKIESSQSFNVEQKAKAADASNAVIGVGPAP